MLPAAARSVLRLCLSHCPNKIPSSSQLPFCLTLLRPLATHTTAHGRDGDRGTISNDEYFAAIHHISNIVRRDYYLERTLNKMRITVTNELVYRVLRSCCRHGIQSFRFFNWARSYSPSSYSPTALEFEELIRTLASTKHWETMWKVVHQLLKDTTRSGHSYSYSNSSSSLSFSPEIVEFIIREYGSNGLIDEAVKVFNNCTKVFHCPQTVGIYNALLCALCSAKNFNGAYSLVRRMIRKGATPDKETYSVLVNGWCKAGKLKEAQDFLKEMSDKGFNPPVRGRDLLIDGLLSAGYIESAKGLVRKMTKEGFLPDIGTFNSLLQAIFKSGEVEFCIELYHDVCRLGLCPDIQTYKIMIPAVAKAGKLDEAFRLLHCSIEDGHKPFPGLYAPILKALCKSGRFDDAFSCFSDMKVQGHPPNRPVYTMLIRMCGRGGRFVEAANYLVEMTELNLVPLSQSFDMVTDGLKNSGKHDLAKRIEHLEVSLRGV